MYFPAYENINTQTLGSDTGSIEFTAISGSFTDLILVANFGVTGSGSTFNFQVGNGTINTSSLYSNTNMYAGGINGTTAISDRASGATSIAISPSFGFNNTGISNSAIFHFMNYSNTNTNKTFLVRANNGGGGAGGYPGSGVFVGLWRSSLAITNIKLNGASTSFKLGSTFTLYGVKAA